MGFAPVVTPVIAVSLGVQAVIALVQAVVPYKPRPEKAANIFAGVGTAIPLVATIFGLALYPAAWNVSWLYVAGILALLAVIPPVAGVVEAWCRNDPQIFRRKRFIGHLGTNAAGVVAATALVWIGQSTPGFDQFSSGFQDKAALNCVLPMTILINFAFMRWQQVNECLDLDKIVKEGGDWQTALTGFSLKHIHQVTNLIFLIAVVFTGTTTVLYLFAYTLERAKMSDPLPFSWQTGVAVALSLAFFYACGSKWGREHDAVYLVFLTGTPPALGAIMVWLALMADGFPRNFSAIAIGVLGYLAYVTEIVLATRSKEAKLEVHFFLTAIFAMTLALLVGALYLF